MRRSFSSAVLAISFALGIAACGDSSAITPDAQPCAGMVCNGQCVDPTTDFENCGACGNACTAGTLCSAGSCVVGCPSGEDACPATGTATYCANLTNDVNNCGACGTTCAAGQSCTVAQDATTAACACPALQPDLCTAGCTNTQIDPQNCGTCGNACPDGQVCRDRHVPDHLHRRDRRRVQRLVHR